MTQETELSADARALLRAALPMDEPSVQQHAELVRRFERSRTNSERTVRRERRAMVWAIAFGCASVSTVALASWSERWLPFLANLPGYTVKPVVVVLPSALPHVQKRAESWSRRPLPVLVDDEPLLPRPESLGTEDEGATPPIAQLSAQDGSSSGLRLTEDNGTTNATRQIDEAEQRVSRHDAMRTAPTSTVGAVESELRLITRARDELRQHDYTSVRRLTERHAREFRNGVFAEERRAMSALSRCLGQGDASAAAAFVQNSPRSVFAARIVRDCGLQLNPVPEPPGGGTH